MEQCFDLGKGFWGDHLYAIYVYTPSKDLGVQDDDAIATNVYAMATYTDPDCTVKNTINPVSILSSSCASSSCCKTTRLEGPNVTISFNILELVSECPSDDLITGSVEEGKSPQVSSLGAKFSDWQFIAFAIASCVLLLKILEPKRASKFNKHGYTNVDDHDEIVEVELPSINVSDKMFKTTYSSDYQQVE